MQICMICLMTPLALRMITSERFYICSTVCFAYKLCKIELHLIPSI